MRHNFFEVAVGAFVLMCATYFFVFSAGKAGISGVDGYRLSAQFDNIDGIASGSDVKMSGVKIGTVESQVIDTETYRAKLIIRVSEDIELPVDSSAKIVSNGLLGDKYVNLEPGADEEMLEEDGVISYTQSSINMEQLLGKFIYGSSSESKENDN